MDIRRGAVLITFLAVSASSVIAPRGRVLKTSITVSGLSRRLSGIDDRSGHDIRLADLLNNFIHGTAFSQLLGKIIRVIIQVVADDRLRDFTRECFLQAS